MSSATTYRFDSARPVPSIGGNVSSLRDVLPLPPGLADPSYAGRGERTAGVMRPGDERGRQSRVVVPIVPVETIPR